MPDAQKDIATISLPERLDYAACASLQAAVLDKQQQGLALRANQVAYIGGAAAELLLAAQARWAADNQAFCIQSPSAAFQQGVLRMGLSQILPIEKGMSDDNENIGG